MTPTTDPLFFFFFYLKNYNYSSNYYYIFFSSSSIWRRRYYRRHFTLHDAINKVFRHFLTERDRDAFRPRASETSSSRRGKRTIGEECQNFVCLSSSPRRHCSVSLALFCTLFTYFVLYYIYPIKHSGYCYTKAPKIWVDEMTKTHIFLPWWKFWDNFKTQLYIV